jgi:hypothetical protein
MEVQLTVWIIGCTAADLAVTEQHWFYWITAAAFARFSNIHLVTPAPLLAEAKRPHCGRVQLPQCGRFHKRFYITTQWSAPECAYVRASAGWPRHRVDLRE